MTRGSGGRDFRDDVISRRRFGWLLACILSALGLPIGSLEEIAAKKRGKHKRKNSHRHNGSGRTPSDGDDGSGAFLDAEEGAFLILLNNYRAAHGLQPLTHHVKLGAAAASHAQDMATNNFTGHIGSNGSAPAERIEREGYHYVWAGENVFWGSPDASVAFEWWKNSPKHNENMLWSHFTETGIRRAYNPAAFYSWYWTNTFGSRQD
jgi:uncharacterized protein YkwD